MPTRRARRRRCSRSSPPSPGSGCSRPAGGSAPPAAPCRPGSTGCARGVSSAAGGPTSTRRRSATTVTAFVTAGDRRQVRGHDRSPTSSPRSPRCSRCTRSPAPATCVPRRGARQRRPPAGHRRARRHRGGGAHLDDDRAGEPRALPDAAAGERLSDARRRLDDLRSDRVLVDRRQPHDPHRRVDAGNGQGAASPWAPGWSSPTDTTHAVVDRIARPAAPRSRGWRVPSR